MKPVYDYKAWPLSPPGGYRSGANYYTQGLFLEKASFDPGQMLPLYTLKEDADEYLGVWYPPARLIYINSKSEHDALSKLVGSFKQWSILKELKWFTDHLDLWQAEWNMMQSSGARVQLSSHAVKNYGAAKALFDNANKTDVGRPKKRREGKRDESDAAAADSDRVVALRR